MEKDTDYTVGSGNVFKDLEFEDAEEMQAKALLAGRIYTLVKRRSLKQAAVAKLLGVSQPRVSNLLNGHLDDFSTEALLGFIKRMGSDVEVVIRDRPRAKRTGHFSVSLA